jgi:hypothetical protein
MVGEDKDIQAYWDAVEKLSKEFARAESSLV